MLKKMLVCQLAGDSLKRLIFLAKVAAKPSLLIEALGKAEDSGMEKRACKKPGEPCEQHTFGKSECCGALSFCIL